MVSKNAQNEQNEQMIMGMGKRIMELNQRINELEKLGGIIKVAAGESQQGGILKIASGQKIAGQKIAGKKSVKKGGNFGSDLLKGVETVGNIALEIAPFAMLALGNKKGAKPKAKAKPKGKVSAQEKFIFD